MWADEVASLRKLNVEYTVRCRIRLGWTAGRDMGALVNYMDGLRCE